MRFVKAKKGCIPTCLFVGAGRLTLMSSQHYGNMYRIGETVSKGKLGFQDSPPGPKRYTCTLELCQGKNFDGLNVEMSNTNLSKAKHTDKVTDNSLLFHHTKPYAWVGNIWLIWHSDSQVPGTQTQDHTKPSVPAIIVYINPTYSEVFSALLVDLIETGLVW